MIEFKKWTSIENFRAFYKNWKHAFEGNKTFTTEFVFDAKVKLHGTNSSILIKDGKFFAGKRSGFVTVEDDNAGFARFVSETFKNLTAPVKSTLVSPNIDGLILYGEWIGPGVQSGVACSNIDNKVFAVFSVFDPRSENEYSYKDSHWPWRLAKLIFNDVENVKFIECIESFQVDLNDSNSLEKFQNDIDEVVNAVCECDPWVLENFNVRGFGEGIVCYSTVPLNGYIFKAKGEKFAEVKQKRSVDIDFEKIAKIEEFVDSIVTVHRLEKKLDECDFPLDISNVGKYIKIVSEDVRKECSLEIEESDFEWKEISKVLSKKAVKYYKDRDDEQCYPVS